MANNIPPPSLSLPPEIISLINEIKAENAKIEKREDANKIDIQTKFLSKSFDKSIHAFIDSYSALTDRLSNVFAVNMAGLVNVQVDALNSLRIVNKNLDLIQDYGIKSYKVLEEIKDKIYSPITTDKINENNSNFKNIIDNTNEKANTNIKYNFNKLIDVFKKNNDKNNDTFIKLNMNLEEFLDTYIKTEINLDKERKEDARERNRKEKIERIKQSFSQLKGAGYFSDKDGGIAGALGKVIFGKRISGIASLIGEFRLGPGKWFSLAKRNATNLGIAGIVGYLTWQSLFGHLGSMYDMFKKEGDSTSVAISKSLFSQAISIIRSITGFTPTNKEQDALNKRKLEAELTEYSRTLKESSLSQNTQTELIKKKRELLEKNAQRDKEWADLYKKHIKALGPVINPLSKIFPTNDELDSMVKAKNELVDLSKTKIKELQEQQKKLLETKNKIYDELIKLMKIEELRYLTTEEENRKKELQELFNIIESEQRNLKKHIKNIQGNIIQIDSKLLLRFDSWENFTSSLSKWLWDGDRKLKIEQMEWKKYWENHSLLDVPPFSWFKSLKEWYIKQKKIRQEELSLKDQRDEFDSYDPGPDNLEEYNNRNNRKINRFLKKSSFEPDEKATLLKTLQSINETLASKQASTSVTAAPTVISTSNATTNNMKNDIHLLADTSPNYAPWTAFQNYSTLNKYGI